MATGIPDKSNKKQRLTLAAVLLAEKPIFRQAMGFSMVTSLLVLSPMLFMLEVYGRVVNSQSATTLLWLLVCLLGVYVLMEVLEMLRGRLLQHAGWRIDAVLRERLHDAVYSVSLRHDSASIQPFNDLRTLREFIASPAAAAAIEAPSSLFFLLLVSLISPWLGLVALIGAMAQVMIGMSTERKTMPALTEANQAAIEAQSYANGVLRNAQALSAMGMKLHIYQRWIARQRKFLSLQAGASDVAGNNAATSKFIQTMQGSLILGISCWLALKGMLLGGGGLMIVASTLGGRVLTPLVQLVAHWRMVVNARDAYRRLDHFISMTPETLEHMPLPAPQGRLSVEGVAAGAPGSSELIIRGISFALEPGENLMIIGPSAAGKTTLARLLMGVWSPASGHVRLDGADLHAWNKEALGPHLGYLPQTVELFDGTLAENIARFGDIDMDKVRAATELVGLSELVASLPQGLSTRIGEEGAIFSGGERQRVGLARAMYGNPNFVLLDEPNASLDDVGEEALMKTLMALKARQCTTVVITLRTTLLPAADKILLLRDGRIASFGPRDEVLAALRQANMMRPSPSAPAGRIPQVAGGTA